MDLKWHKDKNKLRKCTDNLSSRCHKVNESEFVIIFCILCICTLMCGKKGYRAEQFFRADLSRVEGFLLNSVSQNYLRLVEWFLCAACAIERSHSPGIGMDSALHVRPGQEKRWPHRPVFTLSCCNTPLLFIKTPVTDYRPKTFRRNSNISQAGHHR